MQVCEFIHFACTSEDINNLSHALMLQGGARTRLLPTLDKRRSPRLRRTGARARRPADDVAHARPAGDADDAGQGNGQRRPIACSAPAPRIAEVEPARQDQRRGRQLQRPPGGLPGLDWEGFAKRFVESLGLTFNPYTIQIEPHDAHGRTVRRLRPRQHAS